MAGKKNAEIFLELNFNLNLHKLKLLKVFLRRNNIREIFKKIPKNKALKIESIALSYFLLKAN